MNQGPLNWRVVLFVSLMLAAYVFLRTRGIEIPQWLDLGLVAGVTTISASLSMRKPGQNGTIPPPPDKDTKP